MRGKLNKAVRAGVFVAGAAGAWAGLPGCASTQKQDPGAMADAVAQNQSRGLQLARDAQRQADRGETERAIETYKQAVASWREMPAAWNNLGVLLMQEQNYADAVSAFKVAADLSPTDPRPLENIAVCYVRSGWASDALRYYGMSLERDPNRLESLRGAVRAAEMVRVRDEATLERIRRALLVETDERYREYFERQQQLVSAAIASGLP
ncbi:MAG: tetratricopeptide repeat protein [Phycisphaeraceae bacterium]|nr:MAG: tetratricopeptide repeat protein [Phycisphaeraceae bacterium]